MERPAPRSSAATGHGIAKPCERAGFSLNDSTRTSALNLRSLARELGGDVASGGVNFPAPGHSRHDRSARLRFGAQYPDGFHVFSWAGDDWQHLKDYVRDRLG